MQFLPIELPMSADVFIACMLVASALLAWWVLVRFERLGPRSLLGAAVGWAMSGALILAILRWLHTAAHESGPDETRPLQAEGVRGISAQVVASTARFSMAVSRALLRLLHAIGKVVSGLAYGYRLLDSPGVASRTARFREVGPWSGETVLLVDTGPLKSACIREPGSYSRANPMQAVAAAALINRALDDGCSSVGLITPYRAQARLLERLGRRLERASDVVAATVHRLQGGERDWVLLDLVDAFPAAGASRLTGKDADAALRLLNVAISRARGKLLVLADVEFIRRAHPARSPAVQLVDRLQEHGCVVELDWSVMQRETRAI